MLLDFHIETGNGFLVRDKPGRDNESRLYVSSIGWTLDPSYGNLCHPILFTYSIPLVELFDKPNFK